MAVKEKDNFETVTVTAKVARKDESGKRVKEVVDGKKVTVYDLSLIHISIGAVPKNKKTVEALGLRKLNKTVEMPDNESVRGMIRQVRHMVKVEEI